MKKGDHLFGAQNQWSLTPLIFGPLRRWRIALLALAGLGLWSGNAAAFTCTSAGGNWATVGTWAACNGTIPQPGDTVTITAGTVVLNTNSTIAGLTLNGGNLTLGSSTAVRTLTVNGNILVTSGTVMVANNNATHQLNVSGNITNNGTFDLYLDGNSFCAATFTGAGLHTISGTSALATEFYNVTTPGSLTINKTAGAAVTQTGTLSVGGALTVQAGTYNLANTAAVTGATSVSGTLGITSTTGSKTFTGAVTINLGGTWSNTANEAVSMGGDLANSGTFTSGTSTYTFTGPTQWTGSGMTFAGPVVANNNLTVNVSGTVALANSITVTGTTSVTGTLGITSTTGTKTFTGDVTINSGGILSETVAELITYGGNVTINNGGTLTEFGAATMACAGNFQNDGTYTASTGVHTFSGTAKTFSGANAIVIPSTTISGTYQNNGTLTVATTLAGTGTLTNGATGTLNIGAASVTPTLAATAVGNIVNYNRANTQTVKPTAYHHLGLGGTSAKTMTGVTVIGGDLNVSGSATMTSNAAFAVTGALNYSSTGTTTLTAATPISIGTFNQTAGTLAAGANTITVTGTGAGAWTKTGTFTTTGTVIFTGNAPGIGASNFNNLTISLTGASPVATLAGIAIVAGDLSVTAGTLDLATYTANRSAAAGTISVADNATLKIGGTNGFPTNYTTHTLGAASTVEYSGTDQAVGAETAPGYGNLTISGSGTKTAAGNVTVGGTLTLTAGTFAVGANTLTLNGPAIAGAGAATSLSTTSSSSLSFGGTSAGVFLPGSVAALNNLTVNNANGITLNSSPTVSGTLALTAGVVTAGSYTLRSSANCTTGVTVGTGYVAGSVELTFPAGNVTCRFPVGSGSVYAPIDLTTPVGSAGGQMTGSTTGNEHVDVANSPVDSAIDVNRFWTLSGDTISASPYVVTFNFVAGDVDAGADPLGFVLGRYASGAWSEPASPTPSSLAITSSLTGPIVGATDFVAGARGFTCSIPSGSPVGTTCVCDNFNRASLNPSTIYGGSWSVNSVSGSFGLPRIVANRLRLTDNTANNATAATSPGTFPAKGNWVSVEFKHYAYSSRTSRTGTITTSTASPNVTGVGTDFTGQLANGYALYRASDGAYIGTVLSRTSTTALTLTANALSSNAGIAYQSSGAGADGIAMTLSDATQTATPGAFGGSLGFAPKCENGILGCVSDCTIPGGCPGFNYGWVGIGVDEYGNFSNNTEGRTGGSAPGLTLDSVAVRGSGTGQAGYPYLAGTATLPTQIDNTNSATASPGYAYRLMVDARCYQTHNLPDCNNPTLAKTTMVTVDRDITGTGSSYSPLFSPFDAYQLNPSQADLPNDWQLSFTGSTGGANNIHEIVGLKICAQTIVPPAGYRIQVDNLTPTTCPSDPRPTVTISPLNANGQVITTYTNTVTLSATLFGGGSSGATWTSQGTNQGTWDSVNKRYTFHANDLGVAKFYLSDIVQENVYITVTEFTPPGTLTTTLGTPVAFSSGAASFVVSNPDTLGTGVVAGRAHLMRVSRNTVGCGGGTDVGFIGAKPLDGWYNPAAGDHPSGALAPQICAPVSGACLPSYGSCQTLSIAAPVVDSASNNLSLTFAAGVADFCLVTSDVGKYSVGLRDDSVATGTPPVTGTSTTLTARTFAVAVKDVTGNPANNTTGGSVFTTAGTNFPATVEGYLWSSTGTGNAGWGDADGDGLPDVATLIQVSNGGIALHYADTVTLAAGAPFAPVVPTGIAGTLGNGTVTVTGGSTTAANLNYSEVGSFTLTASAATSYLNTSGVDLNPRVAIFAGPANSRTSWVGRFKPHKFSVAGTLVTRSDLQATEAQATPFTYMDEPMKLTLTISAQNASGDTTQNYSDAMGYSKLDAAALGTGAYWFNTGCSGATKCMGLGAVDGTATGLTDRLAIVGSGTYGLVVDPAISWALGIGTVSAHLKFARNASPDGPFETLKIGAMPRDAEGVTVPAASLDLDAATGDSVPFGDPNLTAERRLIITTKARFGRLWLGNACGSDKRDLTIPFRAEYWNGSVFITNTDDSLTSIAQANIGLGNHQPTGFDGSVNLTHIPAGPFSVASGLGAFSLLKPTGSPAAGSVDIVFGLGSTTTTNTTFIPAQPPTAGANLPYLRGKWYDTTYDRDPVARAAFGIYCGGGSGRGPIYIRESY